jgi:hypothetical protein
MVFLLRDFALPFIIPCAIGSAIVDFQLDTGSNITSINERELQRPIVKQAIKKLGGTEQVGLATQEKIKWSMSVNGAPIQTINGVVSKNANVINWTDMVRNWDVWIDSNGMKLTQRSTAFHVPERPGIGGAPLILMDCYLLGKKKQFMLDTGAYFSNLWVDWAKELGIKGASEPHEGVTYTGKPGLMTDLNMSIQGAPEQTIKMEITDRMPHLSWKEVTKYWNVSITADNGAIFSRNNKQTRDLVFWGGLAVLGIYYLNKI